jgi:ketosteroid isomerase-like protein
MKRLAAAFVVALALGGSAWAQSADEAAIRKFKVEDWPRAYRTQDTAMLDRMLADSFVAVDAAGNWSTKAQEIAELRTTTWNNDGFTFTIKRLDIYGGHTAVVAGEGLVRYETGEKPRQVRYQSSNILVKEGGAWRAVASHVSGVKEEPLAPRS